MSDSITNPDLYRRLSEPHESISALNTALTAFYQGVRELREEHGIADLLIVVKDAYVDEDEEVPMMARFNAGNTLNCLPMAAWLYAKEQGDHKAIIREMLKHGNESQ